MNMEKNTDSIKAGCYYVKTGDSKFPRRITICDKYGDPIQNIQVSNDDYLYNPIPSIEHLLNKNIKARPAKIVITYLNKKGRVICFYDKNKYLIYTCPYNGPIVFKEMCRHLKNIENFPIDVNYILENEIFPIDKYHSTKKKSTCNVM